MKYLKQTLVTITVLIVIGSLIKCSWVVLNAVGTMGL